MVRYAVLKGLYDLEKTIGCGGFAKVKLATHIATGEKVAIKIMEKAALGDDLPRVKLEIEAMKTLLHKHVCRLYQVIETDSYYFMVIEYCSGGELFDHIAPSKKPNTRSKQVVTPTQSTLSNSSTKTPDVRTRQSTPTPGSARKVILGLERGLNRVRCVLTPKRSRKSEILAREEPTVLSGKALCNFSSTSSNCPKYVLSRLRRALQHKGIVCRQKGYILQGETQFIGTEMKKDSARPFSSRNACSFELEVCLLKGVMDEKPLVGIRRKRLKGDAWVYKRVCEEVLALAAEDISVEQENNAASKGLI